MNTFRWGWLLTLIAGAAAIVAFGYLMLTPAPAHAQGGIGCIRAGSAELAAHADAIYKEASAHRLAAALGSRVGLNAAAAFVFLGSSEVIVIWRVGIYHCKETGSYPRSTFEAAERTALGISL